MLQDSNLYKVGKVTRFGPVLQLAMLLNVHTPKEGQKTIKALIYKVAAANIVRRRLLSSSLLCAARERNQLIAANGQQ